MTRLNIDPRLPKPSESSFSPQIYQQFRQHAQQVNGLSEGRIANVTNATTAAPTDGTYAQGDKVWNSAPVEAGTSGSKYIVIGFVCTVSGTPGTWLPMRVLTGN